MTVSNERARTAIVATVGPACREPQCLRELVDAGVDVFRLNLAHGSRDEHDAAIDDVHRVARDAGRPVGILVDLAGPKIRLGELLEDPMRLEEGNEVRLVRGERSSRPGEIVAGYPPLIDELSVGDRILLADGTVGLSVTGKDEDAVLCRVTGGGMVRSRQGVNVPGANLGVRTPTDRDREDVIWAAGREVDFVGLSFVRKAEEIGDLRSLLLEHGSPAMVVAKVEKREALDDLDSIVAASDAVMVARGDLGVEIDVAQTPIAQKRIIASCQRHHKPVIVATQMLDSMQRSRRPTRAEVSDVANAILDGADACLLSGETAVGRFPLEAVQMMNRVMRSAEELLRDMRFRESDLPSTGVHPVTSAIVFGAAQIARKLDAKLVVIASRSGNTARIKSKQRDMVPTIGVSDSEATLRRMCLFWGITPLPGAPVGNNARLRDFVVEWGRSRRLLDSGDHVVFVTGSEVLPHAHNLIVVHEVK